jgi:hypothetical protein
LALRAGRGVIASNACSGPFPLLSGRDWDGSSARREARGRRSFGAARRVVVDRFQCLLRPVPAAEWLVWVEVDLGVGLRQVRSSNLRMYRAGA